MTELDVGILARALILTGLYIDETPALPDELAADLAREYADLSRHLIERPAVDRSTACPLDARCYRYQGHEGEHLYGEAARKLT